MNFHYLFIYFKKYQIMFILCLYLSSIFITSPLFLLLFCFLFDGVCAQILGLLPQALLSYIAYFQLQNENCVPCSPPIVSHLCAPIPLKKNLFYFVNVAVKLWIISGPLVISFILVPLEYTWLKIFNISLLVSLISGIRGGASCKQPTCWWK